MAEDPFARLGISPDSSRLAIKKAYRKLCLSCHPDMRADKEQATVEFRELTRIYNVALTMIGKVKPKRTIPPPPPKPSGPIDHRVIVSPIDEFEFMLFGEVSRVALVSPELLEYGGTIEIHMHNAAGYGHIEGHFRFDIPPKTKNGQKFRFALPIGRVEISVVSQRK